MAIVDRGLIHRIALSWPVRLAVSAAVLAAVFWFLPFTTVLDAIRAIDARYWIATLLVFLIGHVVSAAKWSLLANSGAGPAMVLRAHFGGLVANLCLPGVAGGDVVRAGLLHSSVSDRARLAVGSITDRLIDTVGLVLIAAAGALFCLSQSGPGLRILMWAGLLLLATLAALLAMVRLRPFERSRFMAASRWRLVGKQLERGLAALLNQRLRLAVCLALSLCVQLAFIGSNVVLGTAAGIDVPIAAWVLAWPLAKVVATLPVSFGGIGVREASLAMLLAPFGASPALVVATGLLWQSILLAGGLVGAAVMLLSQGPLRRRAPRSQLEGSRVMNRTVPPAP